MFVESKPVPAGETSYDHQGQEGDHSVIRKIVDEHGPAKAHTSHRDSDGTSTVVSHHHDGHTHKSEGHPNSSHAVEHIAVAHGTA